MIGMPSLGCAIAIAMAASGCYHPTFTEGAPCTDDRNCPSVQRCYAGECRNRAPNDATEGDGGGDGDGAPACQPAATGTFSTPTVISELADATAIDGTPSLTGDRLELYFKSDRAGGTGMSDIWRSTRTSTTSTWSVPVPVTELDSSAEDASPEVAADGLTIWLSSQRPGGQGERDIWTSTRPDRTSAWSAPAPVIELNTSARDDGMTVLPSTLVAYLHSGRGGSSALYRTSRPTVTSPWTTPVLVPGQDLGSSSENAWVSPDECAIYFASNRGAGGNSYDLYVATRTTPTDPLGAAVKLTELSSTGWDDDPWLTADQRYVMLNSDRGASQFDLYEARR